MSRAPIDANAAHGMPSDQIHKMLGRAAPLAAALGDDWPFGEVPYFTFVMSVRGSHRTRRWREPDSNPRSHPTALSG
jgi:hypothetical protein